MDFGTLLHVAKKNSETNKNEGKYYSTKFAPPKKECKEKKLSDNIQRFLQKREQEEQEKKRQEQAKLNQLLAMRDQKSKNKIKKMLKVTKSANKSVLDDAVNEEHTAVTMQGPEQPDQDDYGYVSTEANAFYQKYIEKMKDVKEDKGFAPSRPQSLKDLTGTKERVKAAIVREREEKNGPRQRSSTSTASSSATKEASSSAVARAYSTSSSSSSKPVYDPEAERKEEERKKREEQQKKMKNRKAVPPPMDFQALLKLAEQKQHEPVKLIAPVEKKEPERLLTSRERREQEERQRAKEERERRKQEREKTDSTKDSKETASKETFGRIPKLNQAAKTNAMPAKTTAAATTSKSVAPNATASKTAQVSSSAKTSAAPSSNGSAVKKSNSTPTTNLNNNSKPAAASSSAATKSAISSSSSSSSSNSYNSKAANAIKNPYGSNVSKKPYDGPAREFPPRDNKPQKQEQRPAAHVKTKQQQMDSRRPAPSIQSRASDSRKPQQAPKRRIYDDDSEYDSEMDDFIDDGDEQEDISAHIKAIFGYDKARYRYMDEEDDAGMESNFAQVQREEYISKKIGMKEDLEDMKLEAIQKKRKMEMKKRRL